MTRSFDINAQLAHKLIKDQFPQYGHLAVSPVQKQGHDNRTYRLGAKLLIRMPTSDTYALKVPIEQDVLPKLAKYLTLPISRPIAMGSPSPDYPYPFSIYAWLEGSSANTVKISEKEQSIIAYQLADFLAELHSIKNIPGPKPGKHNFWRGEHLSFYDKDAREQIIKLRDVIDSEKAIELWSSACSQSWKKAPVWIHGDLSTGNILTTNGKLSGIIDFGGMALGDPACDLVIAWTYLSKKARSIFINEIKLDANTWVRARGWALWKATFELCKIQDKTVNNATRQKRIINNIIHGK